MPAMNRLPKGYLEKVKKTKARMLECINGLSEKFNTLSEYYHHINSNYNCTGYYIDHSNNILTLDVDVMEYGIPLSIQIIVEPHKKLGFKVSLAKLCTVWTHLNDENGEEYWVDYKW